MVAEREVKMIFLSSIKRLVIKKLQMEKKGQRLHGVEGQEKGFDNKWCIAKVRIIKDVIKRDI